MFFLPLLTLCLGKRCRDIFCAAFLLVRGVFLAAGKGEVLVGVAFFSFLEGVDFWDLEFFEGDNCWDLDFFEGDSLPEVSMLALFEGDVALDLEFFCFLTCGKLSFGTISFNQAGYIPCFGITNGDCDVVSDGIISCGISPLINNWLISSFNLQLSPLKLTKCSSNQLSSSPCSFTSFFQCQ